MNEIKNAIFFVGFALPVSKCDLNMNTSEKGIVASACFAGMICRYGMNNDVSSMFATYLGLLNLIELN